MLTSRLPPADARATVTRWLSVLVPAGLLLIGLVPAAAQARAALGRAAAPARAAPARATPARAAAPGPAAAATIRLGQIPLHRCAKAPLTYCGVLAVPLDYSSAASPDIHIGFRWLPATAPRHAAGTILAVEGGPGFASTGTEAAYVAQSGPLLRTRSLLLVNLRGTGNSTPVNCPGLENAGPKQHGRHFDKLVAACGAQLNHTWRYQHGGGWVHASDLFNTAYSARDVSRLLRALRLGRVDLYGDSYGSWFSQVFASRYPAQLRSVTLDSTYQVLALDPWYTTTVVTARRAFDQACSRSAGCAASAHGAAWGRIALLASRLARSPVTGETTTLAGTRGRVTVNVLTLVNLANNAGFDPVVYRDLDAAGRALLQHHDAAPLLRLTAMSLGFDDTNYPLPEFSDGLYFAVSCTDYVQLFSRSAPPAVRSRQYRGALRRQQRHVFAPFSISQWTGLDQYTEAYSGCLDWPTPVHHNPPITRRPPLVPASLPVLILSGSLDSLTPRLRGATVVARQIGSSARLVTVANLTHVTLQDSNDSCPAAIYQRFVRDPGHLARMSTACARRVSPIHTVGTYPLRLADAVPATATHGNTVGRQALRAASVALASVADEISRWPLLDDNSDLGLRGGRVRFSGGNVLRISLSGVRWVTNATIDGTARWNQSSGWVTARLTVHPQGDAAVRLTARWRPFGQQDQLAVVVGSQGRRHLAAVCPAP